MMSISFPEGGPLAIALEDKCQNNKCPPPPPFP